ncbi:MAG: hypothetical protein EA384_03770 [Spirochaetaceae bacterium]|nr:MAG: hypothetical protein EA384_03770 [Spirochaetaceae bacterium]
MSFAKNRPMIVGLVLLGVAFAVSLTWMLMTNSHRAQRILFFPGQIDTRLQGEVRVVPRYGNTEDDVKVLVKEVILGPADLSRTRVVARETEVRALLVRGRTVYIDLDPRAMFLQEQLSLNLEEAFAAIRRTIGYNFHRIQDVVITVDGQLPWQPHFEI